MYINKTKHNEIKSLYKGNKKVPFRFSDSSHFKNIYFIAQNK